MTLGKKSKSDLRFSGVSRANASLALVQSSKINSSTRGSARGARTGSRVAAVIARSLIGKTMYHLPEAQVYSRETLPDLRRFQC